MGIYEDQDIHILELLTNQILMEHNIIIIKNAWLSKFSVKSSQKAESMYWDS